MKRVLFWFFWLQFGMPFCVATGAMTMFALSGDQPEFAPVNGLFMGLLGTVVYSPFLLLNTIAVYSIIAQCLTNKGRRIVLATDSLLALAIFSSVLTSKGPLFGSLAVGAWVIVSTILILFVPRWAPESLPVTPPSSRSS